MKLSLGKLVFFAAIATSTMHDSFGQAKINDNWSDWANFKKYAEQNKVVTPPKKGERRVVFFGELNF